MKWSAHTGAPRHLSTWHQAMSVAPGPGTSDQAEKSSSLNRAVSEMETGVRVYMDTMTIPLVPLPEIVSVSGYGSMADTDSLSTNASGDTGEKEFKARVNINNEMLKECGVALFGQEMANIKLCFILFIDPLPSLSLPSSWSKQWRPLRTLHWPLI